MIDIHSHILYGVDDGADSREETREMLKIACGEGIKDIIATPHFITGANSYTKERLLKIFNDVRLLIEETALPISMHLGNEIYLDEYVEKEIESGNCLCLAATKYVLVELPMLRIPSYTEGVFSRLIQKGYHPVIAHPERNRELPENLDRLDCWVEMGCLLQINSSSLMGLSGKHAMAAARKLLLEGMVDFVATDCHSPEKRPPRMQAAESLVAGMVGKETARRIFYTNPEALLDGAPNGGRI